MVARAHCRTLHGLNYFLIQFANVLFQFFFRSFGRLFVSLVRTVALTRLTEFLFCFCFCFFFISVYLFCIFRSIRNDYVIICARFISFSFCFFTLSRHMRESVFGNGYTKALIKFLCAPLSSVAHVAVERTIDESIFMCTHISLHFISFGDGGGGDIERFSFLCECLCEI